MRRIGWWTAKTDEERSGENHPELWLSFAEALGVARETVAGSEPLPATQALVDTFVDLTKCQPLVAGLAARYVYESQVPAVAAPYDRCHPASLSARSRQPSPTALPASGRSGRRISYRVFSTKTAKSQ